MKRSVHFLYGKRDGGISPTEAIEYFARMGAENVELPVEPFLETDQEGVKSILRQAADAGIEVVLSTGFPPACDMASDDEAIRKAGKAHMEKILAVMEAGNIELLGGTLCTCWPAYRTTVLTPEQKSSLTQRTAECFAEAVMRAPEIGATLAIEPVNRFEGFLINTAQEGVDFCKAVGSAAVGIMLDGFHMAVEENSIADAVRCASGYLKHLHCAENSRRLPGTGEFPWDAFFGALKEIDYQGRFGIEAFTVAGGSVSASVALWRDLSDNADQAGLDEQLMASLAFLKSKGAEYGFA